MRITESTYSIAEIRDMLDRKELRVNKDYQRASRIWPPRPRSYFIDTIVNGFPFPKIFFYEYLHRENNGNRILMRDIVDGQQRITAIIDFISNKFRLTEDCKEYQGLQFDGLPEDIKDNFLSYTVNVDVIRNAEPSEILEMFRRMNSYTLPLNDAEKRHSTYQGEFKWFINNLADDRYEFFSEFGVFTQRQIVRMADAELLADAIFLLENGVTTTTAKSLESLYQKYDKEFPRAQDYKSLLESTVDYIVEHFGALRRTHMMKPYALSTLMLAMHHNRHGIANYEQLIEFEPMGRYCVNPGASTQALLELAAAHEAKESEGPFEKYVWSCSGGTNTEKRRAMRMRYIMQALRADDKQGRMDI